MKPRDIFLAKLRREDSPRAAVGSATSIVTTDLMKNLGVGFPDAHLEPAKMAALASAGYTELGFDNVMPFFSVWHESAALGCEVDWGHDERMPDGHPVYASINDACSIPSDFLTHSGCAVPLKALALLKREVGDEAAVVGKVFGPWTLAGPEMALMGGTSNIDVVRNGTSATIEADIADKLRTGIDILGPECAVPLDTPYRNLQHMAATAKRLSNDANA